MTARYLHPDVDGYAVVTGTKGRLVLLDVFSKDGGFLYEDRATFNPRTKGPDGWTLEGAAHTPKRVNHKWGKPVRVDGQSFGNRCPCGLERMECGGGGYLLFRRPGGPWEQLEKAPACEAKP